MEIRNVTILLLRFLFPILAFFTLAISSLIFVSQSLIHIFLAAIAIVLIVIISGSFVRANKSRDLRIMVLMSFALVPVAIVVSILNIAARWR